MEMTFPTKSHSKFGYYYVVARKENWQAQ